MSTPPPTPFVFPQAHSTVLPDPSLFFSPSLLSNPLPTNSFHQNFALGNGDNPEYIHPYIVKSSNTSSLSISFPSFLFNASFIYQLFVPDLTISASKTKYPDSHNKTHIISSYDDLSVTLDYPSSNLRFFLVRGSPYLTFSVSNQTEISISTTNSILSISSSNSQKKHTLKLKNKQTWLIYTSSPIRFTHTLSKVITSDAFSGIVRIAINPNDLNPKSEKVLDRFSYRYPVSGGAALKKPFSLEYRWQKEGHGDLLMLAHPLHLRLLSKDDDHDVTVLKDFKYRSIDGDLVGVVGESWLLKTNPFPVTWHSISGIRKQSHAEIISALRKDVEDLNATSINITSSYFYGKLIARAARFALIAEEVSVPEVIPKIKKFLKDTIEPWLNGTFKGNGFLHDHKWGGIITKLGSNDTTADFGFGIYNDHHFHLGYFVYTIAVLAKIDPEWGMNYRPKAYSLVEDFMNYGKRLNPNYPTLRNFDLYKLHSWAAGLTEFPNGRNQESTSEAINAYYSAALMGLAYGDTNLVSVGTVLASFEIQAAQLWWHVREDDELYGKEFREENRVVGILWSVKRDSGLWFAPAESRECRLGIQVLPLLPITEVVFSDVGYVKKLVDWTYPALKREGGVGEGWKGFLYALEGIYDRYGALKKIRKLDGYDDGNSLSNLLWWIHSRDKEYKRG
ncbi:glucan endo-1,3-beta-D-glucosidase ARB_01444 [Ziziphus jujuba]|uniref:glucan endo-1,3-beta-D-glucosidase n=1 Tax=Ziziphus jujuba TaxID=326968 RepID=A0A6P3ZMR9_ZIZJJ|nr:glucan endo-1,3-beta-D-glucosidase ARB_01444 [Ziziphus jujuba]